MISPPPSIKATNSVTSNGDLDIIIAQISQDLAANTSKVQVVGDIHHTGTGTVAHAAVDITCSISGADTFTGSNFSFSLKNGDVKVFVDHTFTVPHAADGTKNVTFAVHYGVTGTTAFGDNKTATTSLTLTRIVQPAAAPGVPVFTNLTPNSVTVSWAPSSSDGGGLITDYKLRRWTGGIGGIADFNSFQDYDGSNLTRNIGNLVPGQTYTFAVYAKNSSVDNGGYSIPSTSADILIPGAVMIRYGNKWHRALVYVRYNGKWHLALPYVRYSGAWHLTN